MLKLYFFIIVAFVPLNNAVSQPWSVEANISMDRYYLLRGKIDDKYDITMYLEEDGYLCGNVGSGNQWRYRTLKGWYFYDKVKTKIPLIGSFSWGGRYVQLFVPRFFLDTIDHNHCGVKSYREKFENPDKFDLKNLVWTLGENASPHPVKLEFEHEFKLETNAEILVFLRGVEMHRFDLSGATGLKFIEEIFDIDAKVVSNELHVTFLFLEGSVPGSSGGGQGGMGTERYLGYFHFDSNLELKEFEYKKFWSETYPKEVENYEVLKGRPELGLIKKD